MLGSDILISRLLLTIMKIFRRRSTKLWRLSAIILVCQHLHLSIKSSSLELEVSWKFNSSKLKVNKSKWNISRLRRFFFPPLVTWWRISWEKQVKMTHSLTAMRCVNTKRIKELRKKDKSLLGSTLNFKSNKPIKKEFLRKCDNASFTTSSTTWWRHFWVWMSNHLCWG